MAYSTNLEAAFNDASTFPTDARLWCISMDYIVLGFLKVMARFNAKGYALPKIVMWNVNARKDTVLSQETIFIAVSSASTVMDGVTSELMLGAEWPLAKGTI